jgi:hypothetical protein
MNQTLQAEIQKRIESFAADLTAVLQRAVADAVGSALKAGPRSAALGGGAAGARARGASLSASELYAALLATGDRNIERIAQDLGRPTSVVSPVLRALVEQGRVRRSGQARGTRYSAVPGKAPAAGAATTARTGAQKATRKAKAKAAKKAEKKPAKKTSKKPKAEKKPATKTSKKAEAKKPEAPAAPRDDKPAADKTDKPAEG